MITIYTSINGELTMGNGKTLSMVSDTYFKYLEGYKIFSNFDLNFPFEYYEISDLNTILETNEKCIILGDEYAIFESAYSTGGKKSKNNLKFLTQTRKKTMEVKSTFQVFNMCPPYMRRLGNNINIISKIHADYTICNEENNEKCNYDFHKYKIYNTQKGIIRYILPHLININIKENKIKIIPNFFYNLYDTSKVIS